MDEPGFKYRAFISYSHRDKAWGDWLHKTLEGYHTPSRLVGRDTRDGPVPRRLYPIFRDRDELPSSANLNDNIDAALRASRYLVVICSPTAAVSRWVSGEIAAFKKLGREDRVLCLVVDGEPNATDHPDSGELECFPPALRYRVDAEGALTTERTEPIAADARPGKDGKANARLKIIAGLLGVGYDELKQREKRRRFWQRVQAAAALVVLGALLSVGWYWQTQRRNVQDQIAQYTEQGRQLSLDHKPLQAAVYLSEAYRLGGRSPVLRLLLAQTMRYVDALDATVSQTGLWITGDISRDGDRVVTASGRDSAEVWDAHHGRPLLSIKLPDAIQAWALFSPDGKLILTSTKKELTDQTMSVVRAWDSASGAERYDIPFPNALLIRAVISGDGRRFLTRAQGRGQGQTKVWDLATGRLLYALPNAPVRISHAGFSPDGRYLVTPLEDFDVRIWDAASGRPLHTLHGHTGEVTDFAFSPDHTRLATVSKDKSARIWDIASGRLLTRIAAKDKDDYDGGHDDEVNVAAFTADGKQLLTGSKDKTARLWDAVTGKPVVTLGRMYEEVSDVQLSKDGKRALVLSQDGLVWLWDMADHTMRAALYGSSAVFMPDSRHILTMDSKQDVSNVWDGPLLDQNLGIAGSDPVFSPDESRVATIDDDGVSLWDARTGKRLYNLALPPDPRHPANKTYPSSMQFSPDGRRLLIAQASGPATPGLWDMASGRQLALLVGHADLVDAAAFTPDGRRIYTCSRDKTARLWDGVSGAPLSTFPMPDGCVDYPRFDPTGRYLAGTVAEAERYDVHYHAELWDLAVGKRLAVLEGKLHDYKDAVAFRPGASELFTADQDGIIRVWDVATGVERRSWDTHTPQIEAAVFTPDGRTLATAHEDGSLKLWDAASGSLRWATKTEEFGLGRIAYSPAGDFILSQGTSKGTRLLDAADGAVLADLDGDSTLVDTTLFSPRGGYIATQASYPYGTRIWDMHLEQRTPAEISAVVSCRVRWRLQAGQLVPATPPPACATHPR